jgi:hypothetical protein
MISKRVLAYICYGFIFLYGLLILVAELMPLPIWWDIRFWQAYRFITDSVECAIILYLVFCLRRLFLSPELNRSGEDIKVNASGAMENTETGQVAMFGIWDPLKCYGKLMVCCGLFFYCLEQGNCSHA